MQQHVPPNKPCLAGNTAGGCATCNLADGLGLQIEKSMFEYGEFPVPRHYLDNIYLGTIPKRYDRADRYCLPCDLSELQLALRDQMRCMETANPISAKSLLSSIQRRAIERWGEKGWLEKLAQEYVKIAHSNGDAEATYENRRRQIRRIFEVEGCNLQTALWLVAAVECRLQLVCTKVEIEDL